MYSVPQYGEAVASKMLQHALSESNQKKRR